MKPGDLVVVVKPSRCGSLAGIGHVFTVLRVMRPERTQCLLCGAEHDGSAVAVETIDHSAREVVGWETWRLLRVDPSAEAEQRRQTEEAT